MDFGCSGVNQIHMVFAPSRIDLLLIGSHQFKLTQEEIQLSLILFS